MDHMKKDTVYPTMSLLGQLATRWLIYKSTIQVVAHITPSTCHYKPQEKDVEIGEEEIG
jgi:hypothetical protein